ncbi:MAG: hypothetical protein IJF83_12850 [Methanobrevibacter sp.]|nr:hypothetical protein [Methanobrevibacter sp.]
MYKNFSNRTEMQISNENTYTGLTEMKNNDGNISTFLKENFEFPSGNFSEITKFIDKDLEMKRLFYNLPKIIAQELEYSQLSLDFMKETDPSEKILEIIIYSAEDEKTLLLKEDIISDGIVDEYPNTENEYIILVEPYVGEC